MIYKLKIVIKRFIVIHEECEYQNVITSLILLAIKQFVAFRNIAAVTWCMCVNGGSVVADAVNRYSTHFNTPAYDIPVN